MQSQERQIDTCQSQTLLNKKSKEVRYFYSLVSPGFSNIRDHGKQQLQEGETECKGMEIEFSRYSYTFPIKD